MESFITVVTTLFGLAWDLYQIPVPIPGISFTYGDIVLASAFGSSALALVVTLMSPGGTSSIGRNTRNPKISEERKGDTK